MKRGDSLDVTLNPGNVLAVTSDASATAWVTRLGDTPGTPPSSPTPLAASTTVKFGPFMTQTRYRIDNLVGAGAVTYSQSYPPVLASQRIISASLTPVSVAANTAAEQSFTVPGAVVNDLICDVGGNTGNATGVVGARVTAADTVAVKFINPTAGPLTPGAGVYSFLLAH